MAVGGSVEIVLKLDGLQPMLKGLRETEKGFENATQSAKDMIKSLESSSKELKQAGDAFKDIGKTMVTGIAVPYATAMTMLGKAYVELESNIAKIDTITSDGFDLDGYTQDLFDASRATGIDTSTFSENVYSALTASIPEDMVMDFNMVAHKLATGGFTDEANAIDVLTTAINAYGYEVSDAMSISDLLIGTQDRGKTTVDELGKYLGDVIPIASDNNVSFEQLSASMALLTRNGIGTARATTYVRSMLQELGKTGSRSDEALRELTGKGFRGLMDEGRSLSDVLLLLDKYAGDNGLTLQDMFGNIRAGTGAMSLLSGEGEHLNELIDYMGDVTGRTEQNFDKISDTLDYRLRKSFNDIRVSGQEVALSLAPVWETVADVMGEVAESVKKLADWFVGLSDETKEFLVVSGLVMSVLSVLVLGFGIFLGALGNITGSFADLIKFFSKGSDGASGFGKVVKGLGGIFKTVWGAIKSFGGLLVGGMKALGSLIMAHPLIALGVLIAVVVGAVIKNWDTLGPYFKQFWDWVKGIFGDAMEWIGNKFSGWGESISTWWNETWTGITDFFSEVTEGIKTKATEFGESVKNTVTEKIGALRDKWNEIWTSVSTFFTETWGNITDFASKAWDTLKNIFTVGFLLVKEIVTAGVKLLLVPFQFIYYNVIQYAQWLWDKIGDTVMSGVDWVADKLTSFASTVVDTWNGMIDWIVGIFTTFWDWYRGLVDVMAAWVHDKMTAFATFVSDLWNTLWTGVSDFLKGIWDGIVAFLEPILQTISDNISKAWTWVKDKTSEIWTGISEFFSKVWKKISDTVEKSMTWVSDKVSAGWNWIKDLTKTVWDGIVTQLTQVWTNIKNVVTSFLNSVKAVVSSVWTAIKNTTSSIWNGIKSVISGVWEGIVSAVTNFINAMKTGISNTWTSIKNTASRTWNAIKKAIIDPIRNARDAVRDAIQKIKDYMKFKWELPKLKMPSFSISGKFSLNPPSVPKFGVNWYATGGIATGPSVVGIGEAGDEAILPLSNKSKMKPFALAVSSMMKDKGGSGGAVHEGDVHIHIGKFENHTDNDVERISHDLAWMTKRERSRLGGAN